MIAGRAFAKINLSLRVAAPGASGLHPLEGWFQSIDWFDRLTIATAEEDSVTSSRGAEVIDGEGNLAWRAVVAVREAGVTQPPIALVLDKEIPVAAGLGGGSADAAAALGLAGALLGVDRADLDAIAPSLGSDVPFCLTGGGARVGGEGEQVDPIPFHGGYSLGLVTPPIEVPTAMVYRQWDLMGGPSGSPLPPAAVPPGLRDEPIVNDLSDAAIAAAPEIAEWRSEIASRWGRPVSLAGSGPTLFSFFLDRDEAAAALGVVPTGARATQAASPVDYGWLRRAEGSDRVIDSKGRVLLESPW